MIQLRKTPETKERTIKSRQSRDSGNIGYKTKDEGKHKMHDATHLENPKDEEHGPNQKTGMNPDAFLLQNMSRFYGNVEFYTKEASGDGRSVF